jgi:hypothetical protein
MNGAFVHLALNHIPVLGIPFGFLLLLGGQFRRSEELVRAGLVAFVFVALITIPAFKSGGPAAFVVRGFPGVVRSTIHEHAEAADTGFLATEILGALALIGLLFFRRMGGVPMIFASFMLVASLLVSGWMFKVAHLGGLIRHPEIGLGVQEAPTAAPPADESTPPSKTSPDND